MRRSLRRLFDLEFLAGVDEKPTLREMRNIESQAPAFAQRGRLLETPNGAGSLRHAPTLKSTTLATSPCTSSIHSEGTPPALIPAMVCAGRPPNWRRCPPGWMLHPLSDLPNPANTPLLVGGTSSSGPQPIEWPLVASKIFSFLDQPRTNAFLGHAGAYQRETRAFEPPAFTCPAAPEAAEALVRHRCAIPTMEWFWSEITVTLLTTPDMEIYAHYLNDLEVQHGAVRNASSGVGRSDALWSQALQERCTHWTKERFSWAMADETPEGTVDFLRNTCVQWSNRADYLISRKSRERREFRKDMTLTQVLQEGSERKRRAQRRKIKDKIREHAPTALGIDPETYDSMTVDVLPREMREALERDTSRVGGDDNSKYTDAMHAYSRIGSRF